MSIKKLYVYKKFYNKNHPEKYIKIEKIYKILQ